MALVPTQLQPVPQHSRKPDLIEQLSAVGDPASVRELIEIARTNPWRETRMAAIRGLGQAGRWRGVELLMEIAVDTADLPLALTAIQALGNSREPLAGRFLIQLATQLSGPLAPAALTAAATLPERMAGALAMNWLQSAVREDGKVETARYAHLKAAIYAVGELKVHQAAPILAAIVTQSRDTQISAGAVTALAKVSRDPAQILDLGPFCAHDPFLHAAWTTAKNQVAFRVQWQLEAYLNRIFAGPDPHPSTYFELNSFDLEDVKAGLTLYLESHPERIHRFCRALAAISDPSAIDWYTEWFDPATLPEAQVPLVLASVARHRSPRAFEFVMRFEERCFGQPAFFDAASVCCEDAIPVFANWLSSESPLWDRNSEAQMACLNSFISQLQTRALDRPSIGKAFPVLEGLLDPTRSPAVRARAIRGFAALKHSTQRVRRAAAEMLADPESRGSATLFFERMASQGASDTELKAIFESFSLASASGDRALGAWFRAFRELKVPPAYASRLAELCQKALDPGTPRSVQAEVLRLLTAQPIAAMGARIAAILRDELQSGTSSPLAVHAAIALGRCGSEVHAEILADAIQSTDPVLRGMALDSILRIPGLRAKRLAMDHCLNQPDEIDALSKLLRSFVFPSEPVVAFIDRVATFIDENPDHPLCEGFEEFAVKLRSAGGKPATTGAVTPGAQSEETRAIDRALEREIPSYPSMPESVKSALRAAEIPVQHPGLYDESVDKASSVLEYTKAIDLLLETHFGKKVLFPRIERSLIDFQNHVFALGLDDRDLPAEKLMQSLGLDGLLPPQAFPGHKMGQIAFGVITGRITQERFRLLDGLRAWASSLLLFSLRPRGAQFAERTLIPLPGASPARIIELARRLMALQDLRNPAAHRQTMLRFLDIQAVRREVLAVINLTVDLLK